MVKEIDVYRLKTFRTICVIEQNIIHLHKFRELSSKISHWNAKKTIIIAFFINYFLICLINIHVQIIQLMMGHFYIFYK
jgi:hypothetical protein